MNEVLSFDDEAQAYEEIEAMGYHAMAFDFPAEENELHWQTKSHWFLPENRSQTALPQTVRKFYLLIANIIQFFSLRIH